MRKILFALAACFCAFAMNARTLVAYYSYTNNVESIVNTLSSLIDCDVLEIEPAEKGLDYAANNYAIGSAQIAAIRNNPDDASSYPEIDPVEINLDEYSTVIIAAPLWWSQMAAPMQTFLFKYGAQMAGKNIGLIVSSASSGISGVEADARRLIPDGKFLSSSLWIRSSQTSNAKSLIETWLNEIEYGSLASIHSVIADDSDGNAVYSLSGVYLGKSCSDIPNLPSGIYIINGKKTFVAR
ncbi:MAG: hypothetical protein K2J46_03515 [Muribaculaceae bacterium]|nr:hypothetical protein [Muribaculaceae bacterium]